MRNGKPFVLFADDHDDSRYMMAYAAKLRGWETEGASTAREMMDLVNRYCTEQGSCFDAIVADIQFHNGENGPRMSGITAIDAIRKRHPNIPVLYFSAYISSMNRSLIRAQGADFLEKPKMLAELMDRIKYMMDWATSDKYKGRERRMTSINHSAHQRRKTDMIVSAPRVVEDALTAARLIQTESGELALAERIGRAAARASSREETNRAT